MGARGSTDELADFGGHSRFSLMTSFAESPVILEMTLELLPDMTGPVPACAVFLFCCSNLPMRFATLARGLSSGRGISLLGFKD